MRIAICTDQYLPLLSGIADSIDILARELERRGHVVRIYAPEMPGAEHDDRVMRLPTRSINKAAGIEFVLPRGMMADITAFKPDVIHAHTVGVVGLVAWRAARTLKVPLVGTDHTLPAYYLHYANLDFPPFPYLAKKISAWYYGRCDFVTAPSVMMLAELKFYGMRRPSKVIPNHIPTHLFKPPVDRKGLKERVGIPEQAVLLFGRIAVEKNLTVALDAFQEVAKKTGAMLVVVGDGPYKEAFQAAVAARDLEQKVMMLGVLRGEQLAETVAACDVFLITSRSETQSMTTMQALASAVPVVAANAGGLPEYVHDRDNGLLVESYDASGFAERLQHILTDRSFAARLSDEGRKSVLPFSPEHTAEQFVEVYSQVIDESKKK